MNNPVPLILYSLFLFFLAMGVIILLSEDVKKNSKEIESLKAEIHELKYPSKLLLLPDEMIEGPGREN